MALQNAYAEQGAHHCALRHTQEQAGAVHGEKRIGHNDVCSENAKHEVCHGCGRTKQHCNWTSKREMTQGMAILSSIKPYGLVPATRTRHPQVLRAHF